MNTKHLTDKELDEIAWKAICQYNCSKIICDGPAKDEDMTCEHTHQMVRAVIAMLG